jgi:hypothetical protein
VVEAWDRLGRQRPDVQIALISQLLKTGLKIGVCRLDDIFKESDFGTHKWTTLSVFVQLAYQESLQKSERIAAAWQMKRTKARMGILISARIPPWLRVEGEGEVRRAVVIPEKVTVVQRLFDMVLGGMGVTAIAHQLIREGVPPLTKKAWSQTTIRRFIKDRSVLGEFQPLRDGKKEGEPIAGYYPQIISLTTFHKAQSCRGSKERRNIVRGACINNMFSGLLRDARSPDKFYFAQLRVEDNGHHHHVLQSADQVRGASSFPLWVFERGFLALLREVKPSDIIPTDGGEDAVFGLQGEIESTEADMVAIRASLDHRYSRELDASLRRKEEKKAQLGAQLREAQARASAPLVESWGEAKSLLGALEGDGEAKYRLRAVLRRLVGKIVLLVVRRKRERCAFVEVEYAAGVGYAKRLYIIWHRPPCLNGSGGSDGYWWAMSSVPSAGFDLTCAEDQEWAAGFVAAWVEPAEGKGKSFVSEHLVREVISAR